MERPVRFDKGLAAMPDLLISVITPSLNSARYIKDAVESVLSQGYPNFEHIVVDGGSTDETIEILKSYPHLKWISEPDRGQSDAMNKGFSMSKGDVIVYLNSDDYLEPGAFSAVLTYFEKGEKFVVGNVRVLSENGTFWINNPHVDFSSMLRWWRFNSFCYNPGGYFFLKEVLNTVGLFDEQNQYTMDWDFLLRSALCYKFCKIDSLLATYRRFEGTKSKESICFEKNLFAFSKVYWKHISAIERLKIFVEFNCIDILRFNRFVGMAARLVYFLKFKIIDIKDFMERFYILNFVKSVAIFGASAEGEKSLIKCRENGVDVKFFIDISVETDEFNGLPLYDVNKCTEKCFAHIEAILIADNKIKNKIKRMLDSTGFKKLIA
ncbi:glycosyltransferase family 2 protein [Candidatus Magnetomonas plexicatena]|uniref:glycosyltransferase family 2 protein n=1 Tax=Candidatus Magnetomonas plexicatena TaxID=2552947 RepID=UPI0011045B2B|nr:glycosyltransferase [Nitrospirales bacterium LBB_01]